MEKGREEKERFSSCGPTRDHKFFANAVHEMRYLIRRYSETLIFPSLTNKWFVAIDSKFSDKRRAPLITVRSPEAWRDRVVGTRCVIERTIVSAAKTVTVFFSVDNWSHLTQVMGLTRI